MILLKFGPPLCLHLIRFELLLNEQQIHNMADPPVERRGHLQSRVYTSIYQGLEGASPPQWRIGHVEISRFVKTMYATCDMRCMYRTR